MTYALQPSNSPGESVPHPVSTVVSLGCLPANSTWSSSLCRAESAGQEQQNEERNYRRIMELRRNPPIFMTLQETADFLQISPDTVRRQARAGRIHQFNRGTRNPLFASAELIASIKEAY
jgi:hypothetical protein